MPVVASKKALESRRDATKAKLAERSRAKTLVNVSCGTCGIASGAEKVLAVMRETVRREGIPDVEFMRSGCMTYCYAEPTVTITRPDSSPVTFGYVDEKKAAALVIDFIGHGKPVDGEIPINYERVVL